METSIFLFSDYKIFLKAVIESSEVSRGLIGKLARAAGCQSSYLSQALHMNVHLTPDHGAGIAEYLNLKNDETDYFLLLIDLARAGRPELRQRIKKKMAELKQANEDITKRLQKKPSDPSRDLNIYYSTWLHSALHILVSIPAYRRVSQMEKLTRVPSERIQKCLNELESLGLVRREQDYWINTDSGIHTSKSSLFTMFHHKNWRSRAMASIEEPLSDGVHFSGIYSIAKKDFDQLNQLVLASIERANDICGPSEAEEVICLNFDLFRIFR